MTTVDGRVHTTDGVAGERREAHRREIAELLDLDPAALPDAARLVEDLSLDSLAMMTLLTWMESRGVTIGAEGDRPAKVGEVLSLLAKAAVPGLSITVTGGQGIGLPGAVAVPGPLGVAAPRPAEAGPPLAPVLGTSALRLTPVTPDDIGFLYALTVDPETGFRWRYRGAAPPIDRFAAELWTQVLMQYVVRRTGDGEPVGHVVAYAPDQNMRYAHVGAVFRSPGTGLAAQAVALFVRYLFHTFPLHKLYLEIPGYNWPQVSSGQDRLFDVEGVLGDHDYYAGRLWDQYVCAIYRDRLPKGTL
ncbi:MAG TPA: GNAT family N-acetyltransferase [Pilimelia sp.]|nr:GNAT family N-acetyltransferase [Pilimelia sp.]